MKLRILHIITTASIGGAENHLLQLCRGLVKRGVRCGIIFLKGDGSLVRDFEESGIKCVRISIYPTLTLIPRLVKAIKKFKPDIVNTHLIHADLSGILAARLSGVRGIVSTKHNDDDFRNKLPIIILEKFLTYFCDRVIAISDHVGRFMKNVEGLPARKIKVVRYGYDFKEKTRTQKKLGASLTVLTICRLVPQKGLNNLIEAAGMLAKRGYNIKFVIAGEGPLEAELKAFARRKRAPVKFLGFISDTDSLYEKADLFCLPSRWEGLGLVLLEAMEYAIPIVASAVSAIPETVSHMENGLLVPPDNPDALASSIAHLYSREGLRNRLGEQGKTMLRTVFSIKKDVNSHMRIYSEIDSGFEGDKWISE